MSSLAHQEGGNHYKSLAIQPIEYITKNKLPFIEGCVIKYVTRHRDKNGKQDILKAIHFLQMLLELEYPDGRPSNSATRLAEELQSKSASIVACYDGPDSKAAEDLFTNSST